MEQSENPIIQRRNILCNNVAVSFVKGEAGIEVLDELDLIGRRTFEEQAVVQLLTDLRKAESTGYFGGQKISADDLKKAKEETQKLEKKVVKHKDGGTKTVYVKVDSETKPHPKMTHEEL